MANAYGSMEMGYNIGSKTSKDYTAEIGNVITKSIGDSTAMIAKKQSVMQAKFDSVMETFTESSMIPTVTADERTQIQPIIDETSLKAQEWAAMLVADPSNLEAQAGYNDAISTMNRITQAQTNKYKQNENAAEIHNTNSYSAGQKDLEGNDTKDFSDAKAIVANDFKSREFDSDGYETYTMNDGTIYDNNPNTEYPAPPRVEGKFKAGHATVLKSWNANVTDNNTYNKINEAAGSYNVDGSANTLYEDLMTSGPDGKAPSYGNKMDLLFGDISGDGQDMSYAEMFINGKLGDEYYLDQNGDEMMYKGRPISSYPEATNPTSLDAISDPSTAQDDTSPNRPMNRAEALEAILRDKNLADQNLRGFTKLYANTIKSGLEQKKIDIAMKDNRVLLDMNGEPDERFGKDGFFDSDSNAQDAKKSVYVDMKTDNVITNFMNSKVDGKKLTDNSLIKMFKNESNLRVKPILNKNKDGVAGVSVYTSVDKFGKGSGKKLTFDLNDASDLKEFKRVMMNEADMFKDLPTLNGDPRTWGIDVPTINTTTEEENANSASVESSNENQEEDNSSPTSILESSVTENYNVEENLQGNDEAETNSFNIQGTPINQGYNF